MNTEQTAQQLELAAQILRTGHPWEWENLNGTWFKAEQSQKPETKVCTGHKIRPILATPPDNRPLHNPDNLTAEQVGAGYRLMLKNELVDLPTEYWSSSRRNWERSALGTGDTLPAKTTYRLPLSVPWSEPKPDPYAELKKAHAEGKVIQFVDDGDIWRDIDEPNWKLSANEYRIKPKLTFQLPPPPPGMQWHRTDGWGDGDLPQGYRPLLVDEFPRKGDECITKPFESEWCESNNWRNSSQASEACHYRTRRPLTFTHAEKQWTWHRPGDPMPCAGLAFVTTLLEDGGVSGTGIRASRSDWNVRDNGDQIIGWRYSDENKPNDETITDFSDNEILQLRQLLNLFSPVLQTQPNKMGKP